MKTTRTTLCTVAALTMCMALNTTAYAEVITGTCGNSDAECHYVLNTTDSTLTISGTGMMRNWTISIPPWYNYRSSIKYVSVSGVSNIGGGAFDDCSALTSISIPSGVTTIGGDAFYGCSALTSVSIPSGVTTIGTYAFKNCTALTSVNIPSSVTTIDNHTFQNCTALTSVNIPNGVTTIATDAFSGCTALTSINIPSSVTTMVNEYGYSVFSLCPGLTAINVDANNANYSSQNGVLFNKNKTTLIQYPSSKQGTAYNIPSSVTTISRLAFRECSALTSVTIPSSVTTIGGEAFYGCTALTSVTIPSSVTTIDDGAFLNCTSLTSVYSYAEGPADITGNNVFRGISLGNVDLYIPAGTAAAYAAAGWTGFNSVNEASGMGSLTGVTLNKSTYDLGPGMSHALVFTTQPTNATNQNVTWTSSNPAVASVNQNGVVSAHAIGTATISVTTHEGGYQASCSVNVATTLTWNIGWCGEAAQSYDDPDCTPTSNVIATLNTLDSTLTISGSGDMKDFGSYHLDILDVPYERTFIRHLIVEDGVTSIGERFGEAVKVFYWGGRGLNTVTIANSVRRIGWGAFRDDFSAFAVKSLVIPHGVEQIKNIAFQGCNVNALYLPASLTTIGIGALSTANTTDIYNEAATPVNIVDGDGYRNAFNQENVAGINLHVPPGSEAAYMAAPRWRDFHVVTRADSVVADVAALALTRGDVRTLHAQVLPENTYNKDVTWTSSDPAVVRIIGNELFAMGVGSALVVVAPVGYASARDTIAVTVTAGGSGASCDAITAAYRQDTAALRAQVRALAQDTTASHAKVRTLKQDTVASHAQVRALKQDTVASHAQVRALAQDTVASHAQVRALKQDTAASHAQVRTLKQDTAASHAQVRALAQDTAALRASMSSITALSAQVAALAQDTAVLYAQVRALAQDTAALRSSMSSITALSAQVVALAQDTAVLYAQVRALVQDTAALRASMRTNNDAALSAQVAALQSEVRTLNTRAAMAEYNLSESQQQLSHVSTKLGIVRDSVTTLTQQLNAAISANNLLQMQLLSAQSASSSSSMALMSDSIRLLKQQNQACLRVNSMNAQMLNAFPNPATNGEVVIYEPTLRAGEIVRVYDRNGTLMGEFPATGVHTIININAMPTGLYIIKAGSKAAKVINN